MKRVPLMIILLGYFISGCSSYRGCITEDSRKILNFKHDHGKLFVRYDYPVERDAIYLWIGAKNDSVYPPIMRHGSCNSCTTLFWSFEDTDVPNYNKSIDTLFTQLYQWIEGLEDFWEKIKIPENKHLSGWIKGNQLFEYHGDVLIKDTNGDVGDCSRMNFKDITAFKKRIVKYTNRHHIEIGR